MNNKKIFLILFIFSLFFLFARKCQGAEGKTNIQITEDTYVSSGIHMTNNISERHLFAGYNPDSIRQKSRIYLKVDLAQVKIPVEDIYSVKINIYQYNHIGTEPYSISIMTPIYDWETNLITWLNQPTTVIFNNFPSISPDNGWKSFDITYLVKKWMQNGDFKKGLMIKMSPDSLPVSEFWSFDCIFALNLPKCLNNEQPYLEITHFINTPPVIDENFYPEEMQIIKDDSVKISLDAYDPDNHKIKYKLEISRNNFKSNIYTSEIQDDNTFNVTLDLPGRYQWRIIVLDELGASNISDIHSFIIQPINQNIPQPNKPKKNKIEKPINNNINKTEIINKPIPKVLGKKNTQFSSIITKELCIIKYFEAEERFEIKNCKLSVPIIENVILHNNDPSNFLLEIYGKISPKILIRLEYYRCAAKTILKPRTLFKCINEKFKEVEYESTVKNYIYPLTKNSVQITNSKSYKTGIFKIQISFNINPENNTISLKNRQTITDTVSGKRFVFTIESEKSKQIIIPKAINNSYPLEFPFKKNIGVTQWYGKTSYSNLHTGIDFGSNKEKIYAPANGTITFSGWDNYYGKCLSGGNIVNIKHDNGLHSLFLHLASFGKNIKKGNRVKKGDFIGTTGNSGKYNCQNLAYHLHFETRTNSNQNSHTNPVPLVAVNWSNISTLKYKTYPGRLSGQNPHPLY